jgi:hypothetical protein
MATSPLSIILSATVAVSAKREGKMNIQTAMLAGTAMLAFVVPVQAASTIRVATFNASLNRNAAGSLMTDLGNPGGATNTINQAKDVAEIIQRVGPDILLINEFDYVPGDAAANAFNNNFLKQSQNVWGIGATAPVDYGYVFTAPSNTGIASGFDLNNNGFAVTTPGAAGYGDDALGFGNYVGQYGMAIFSKYAIDYANVRTFQTFLWKDMPGALLPDNLGTPEASDWYSAAELAVLPLSSKSHWDIPIIVDGVTIHILAAHPTPPTFDGAEDRNGLRNHDEIRLWADYVSGTADYLYDDNGVFGGLAAGTPFVILGDYNADPNDGDSSFDAIDQLLLNGMIDNGLVPASAGGAEAALLQGGANALHVGDPTQDTADFADGAPGNLRADYVLPSVAGLDTVGGGVFWPTTADPLYPLTGTYNPANFYSGFPASDHRLVYKDLALTSTGAIPEPASWALMIGGFALAGGTLRQRRVRAILG